jgi:hypothetical protein
VVGPILQEHTKSLIEKTSSLLHEMIPNNERVIETQLKLLQQTVKLDIVQLLSDPKHQNFDSKLNDFATQLDIKFSNLVTKCVNTSEERIINKIGQVTDTNAKISVNQDKLSVSINEIADKFKNSSHKGNISENILFNLISNIFPTSEVVDTSKDGKCGDLLLKRTDKTNIMIENKSYIANVPKDEVVKFQRDTQLHDYNAIFLSQTSGITGKPNFFIEINNKNNILLYIHKVGYSSDLIKLGVDVIDTISEFINKKVSSIEDIIHIDYTVLDTINREVQIFVNKKKDLIEFAKESHRNLINKIEEMCVSSSLLNVLNQHFGSISSNRGEYECNICHKFSGKSAASLGAHRRRCKVTTDTPSISSSDKNKNESTNDTDIQTDISDVIHDDPIEEVIPVSDTVETTSIPIHELHENNEVVSTVTEQSHHDKKRIRRPKAS